MYLALPCILSQPCKNSATCTNDNVGGYTCTCPRGYTGKNCEIGLNDYLLRENSIFIQDLGEMSALNY